MRRPVKHHRLKQPTSPELIDSILDLIRVHFYEGNWVELTKHRRHLLSWAVLWPASWLNEKGVTIPATRYREIMHGVIMQAVQMRGADSIKYPPAYLGKVIQSHFAMHGDEIYEEAKSVRSLTETAILLAGASRQAAPDPVAELAAIRRLAKAVAPQKRATKAPVKEQLSLF
jgi:hypothetical protein